MAKEYHLDSAVCDMVAEIRHLTMNGLAPNVYDIFMRRGIPHPSKDNWWLLDIDEDNRKAFVSLVLSS